MKYTKIICLTLVQAQAILDCDYYQYYGFADYLSCMEPQPKTTDPTTTQTTTKETIPILPPTTSPQTTSTPLCQDFLDLGYDTEQGKFLFFMICK